MRIKTGTAHVPSLVVALALGTASLTAGDVELPLRLTAHAVNLGTPGPTGSLGNVEIVVNRWSTDAERDRLLNVLLEKGEAKLLEELQGLPRVGYIRTPNSVGYDLHYARHAPAEDGGDQIVIATDRYISFWEAYSRPRTIDYPFTFIEIHLNGDGEGEGKMSLATKVMADKEKNQIVLENYASQPVLLQAVRAQRASQ
jgi:hypothetical protein